MIDLRVSSVIRIPREQINDHLKDIIKSEFVYFNPNYFKMKAVYAKMYDSGKIQRNQFHRMMRYLEMKKFFKSYVLSKDKSTLVMFRGVLPKLLQLLHDNGYEYHLHDRMFRGQSIKLDLHPGELDDFQQIAVDELVQHHQAVLVSPVGSGKTKMMLHLISRLQVPTLIIVHTSEILKNWHREIEKTIDYKHRIGQIGGGKRDMQPLTVAMLQTLMRFDQEEWDFVNGYFGCVVMSECHHSPPLLTSKILNRLKAYHRYGETASQTRKDGREPLIFDLISQQKIEVSDLDAGATRTMSAMVDFTEIKSFEYMFDNDYVQLISALTNDEQRNQDIVARVQEDINNGHFCLILSDRVEHCRALSFMLERAGTTNELLIGEVSHPDRNDALQRVRSGQTKAIVASANLASEGIDVPILSSLHLVTPSNNFELLKQRTGRIRRICEGKKDPIIHDYVDLNCSYLHNIAKIRSRYYKKLGFLVNSISRIV